MKNYKTSKHYAAGLAGSGFVAPRVSARAKMGVLLFVLTGRRSGSYRAACAAYRAAWSDYSRGLQAAINAGRLQAGRAIIAR